MKGLDYSKFKKIGSTAEHTVLKHKDGHELKIAHKGLSPKHKEELHRLPMAKGGEVKHYAAGTGEVKAEPVEFEPGKDYSKEPLPGEPNATPIPPPEPVRHEKQAMVQALKGNVPYENVPEASEAPQEPSEVLTQPPPQTPNLATQPEPTSQILQPSQPTPETPKQELQDEEKTLSPVQAAKDTEDFFSQEFTNFDRDISEGHIQPHNYGELFDRKDTLGKISSVFGLILSGAGSLLTINPAPLMNFMDREITRDLNAQVKSNENAQNWYRLNQQSLKNMSDIAQTNVDTDTKSYALSKDRMFQVALDKMARETAHMPDNDPRKPAANRVLAMMYPLIQERSKNAATIQASAAEYQKMLFGVNQPSDGGEESQFNRQIQGLRMLGPEGQKRADYLESRYIPGVGRSKIPLSEANRKSIEGFDNFKNILNEAVSLDSKIGRLGAWTPTDKAQAKRIKNDLVSSYNDVKGLARFTGNEEKLYNEIVGNLGSANLTGSQREVLKSLQKSVETKKKLAFKQLGIEPFSSSGQSEQLGQDNGTVERVDRKTGKIVVFDAKTKKALGFK